MFWHNFKYTLKILFKNKVLIFWTLAFPLIMALLFNMAFSDIENSESLSIFDIAVVGEDEIYTPALESLSEEGNTEQLFRIKEISKDDINTLLSGDEVVGVVELEEGAPRITVKASGIEQTVLRTVVENIAEQKETLEIILQEHPEKMREVMAELSQENQFIKDVSPTKISYTMIEYYTLVAMACLYGGILAMAAVGKSLANLSASGKRITVSPAKKGVVVLSSLLASYLVQLVGLIALFALMIFGLKVDFGDKTHLVILLSLVGSLTGLALGLAIAVIFKVGESAKTGILLAVTMTGCFFAGMMGIGMKNLIDTNAPIINLVNPAALITDGLYSIYYYTGLERFWRDVMILSLITITLVGIASTYLGRQKYDRL